MYEGNKTEALVEVRTERERTRADEAPPAERLLSRRRFAGRITALLAALLSFVSYADVMGQTTVPSPGQLAPRVLTPDELHAPPPVVVDIPESHGEMPPGVDAIQLTVGSFEIDDGESRLAAPSDRILEAIRGREIAASELYKAAEKIERLYVDRGYFLTRVVVPPQKLANGGTLKFRVVHGFIEAIEASDVSDEYRQIVVEIMSQLVNRPHLTSADLERQLLIAGDIPAVDLKATLEPGLAPGAVRLRLTGHYRAYSGQFSIDNSLPQTLGRYSTAAYVARNSLLMAADQLYVNIGVSNSNPVDTGRTPRRLIDVGWRTPLGVHGLNVTVDATASDTRPIPVVGEVETHSAYERGAIKFDYPIIKTRNDTFTTRASFEAVHENQIASQFDTVLYDDQMRVVRTGGEWHHAFDPRTDLTASVDWSKGLHVLGSHAPSQGPSGPTDTFSKVESRLRVHRELPRKWALDVQLRSQYARSRPLSLSEKFTVGGPQDLSSLDTAVLSGDRGWVSRAELQYSPALPDLGASPSPTLQSYGFAGHGSVDTLLPSAVERASSGVNSLGVGARATLRHPGPWLGPVDFGIEGARTAGGAGASVPDHWRVNAYINVQF